MQRTRNGIFQQAGAAAAARKQMQNHPLRALVCIAAAARLFAVLFAKGFMASDDYFVYLHIPWLWSHGQPAWFAMDHPSGFSIVYPGFNYLFIEFMRWIGVVNPDTMMYFNRALHAAWSLVGVIYAYRLALLVAKDMRTAFLAGLLAALFWFLPYGSARNLPEMVCVPFVMMALFYAERAERENGRRYPLIAGLAIGAAFIVRYQALAFGIPVFAIFAIRRRWRALALFSLGALALAFAQGTTDLIAYGKFFGAPLQYFLYNVRHSAEYITGPWYRYLLLYIGIFIPPFSLLFLGSIGGAIKRAPITFWAAIVFFTLHSVMPAKQERFVIPDIVPVIVLGCCGMFFMRERPFFRRIEKYSRRLWAWFWAVNAVLLILFTFHYGKRGQVEALNYLYARGDAHYVLVDRTDDNTWLPCFYLDIPENHYWWISGAGDWTGFDEHIARGGWRPEYALIADPKNLQSHLEQFAEHGVAATVLDRFGPGPLEWLLWKANPKYNSPNAMYVLKLNFSRN